MKRVLTFLLLLLTLPAPAYSQLKIVAGSSEDSLYRKILEENNSESRVRMIVDFETAFPKSKLLIKVYLLAMDTYRERKDRAGVRQYGERALAIDAQNVTVMLVLARNYAIEGQELDHAVELAERAVSRLEKLKRAPVPGDQREAVWTAYVKDSENAAREILSYCLTVRGQASDKQQAAIP